MLEGEGSEDKEGQKSRWNGGVSGDRIAGMGGQGWDPQVGQRDSVSRGIMALELGGSLGPGPPVWGSQRPPGWCRGGQWDQAPLDGGALRDPRDGATGAQRDREPQVWGSETPRKGQRGSPGAASRIWGSDSLTLGGLKDPRAGLGRAQAAPRPRRAVAMETGAPEVSVLHLPTSPCAVAAKMAALGGGGTRWRRGEGTGTGLGQGPGMERGC